MAIKTISGHKARGFLRSQFVGKELNKRPSGKPGQTKNADAARELRAFGLSQAEVARTPRLASSPDIAEDLDRRNLYPPSSDSGPMIHRVEDLKENLLVACGHGVTDSQNVNHAA